MVVKGHCGGLHLDDPVVLRALMAQSPAETETKKTTQPAHSFEETGTTNGWLLWCLHAND